MKFETYPEQPEKPIRCQKNAPPQSPPPPAPPGALDLLHNQVADIRQFQLALRHPHALLIIFN